MFRSRRSRPALFFLLGLAAASPAEPAARPAMFEVAGTLEPARSGLRVRVTARNVGGSAAERVRVAGQLLGNRASVGLPHPVAPGTSGDVVLDLPGFVPVAGAHALTLRFDYDSAAAVGEREPLSQWAYLMLAFGAVPVAAVRLDLPPARFAETARLPVRLQSVDGRAHRVRLSVHVPVVLGAVPHRQTVDVPSSGEVVAQVRLFRGSSAPRTHGVLALAATEGEEVVSTAAATGLVEVSAEPARLPRARALLAAAAVLLLAASAVAQWRRGVLRSPTV